MREAAAAALEMAGGHQRADASSNLMLAMALTRCLEVLGEAASRAQRCAPDFAPFRFRK
jgi:uncharacterized protein with HEPN domain